MSADKTLSWSYTEEFPSEDEQIADARLRGIELGIAPVSSATGAALKMLAAAVAAKSVAEVGTGTGVSGLCLLGGMGSDGVLTTIDVEPELQREARRAFDGAGYPSSRTRIIQGRASDVMPRMAAAPTTWWCSTSPRRRRSSWPPTRCGCCVAAGSWPSPGPCGTTTWPTRPPRRHHRGSP